MVDPANLGPVSSVAGKLLDRFHNATSWRDRVKPAAYKSPVTGTRVPFLFEDLSRSFDIRGTAFDFPGVNNSYVQQTGYSSRKYPMVCYFTGKNCDLLAGGFEAALMEAGIGQLEHPLYGTFPALPFGTVERNDALKSASNQSVVTVTFWTSIPAIYPSAATGGTDDIDGALKLFNAAVAAQFAASTKLNTAFRQQAAISTIGNFLKKTKARLAKISSEVADVRNDFGKGLSAVNGGLDVLVGGPLLLAQQISNLIQAPGRALAGLSTRLDAYARLAADIFGSDAALPAKALGSASILVDHQAKVANDFHISGLFALNAVAGSVVSAIAQPTTALSGLTPIFGNRTQILAAAAAVLEQMDAAVAWRDGGFEALGAIDDQSQAIDTGEAYAALQTIVAMTAGYLIQASFSAQPERAIVLDRARTIIDVCGELYRTTVDSKLDLLISTNDLTGSEILELPQGRRIVWYPEAA